jgi:Thiamine pyrophosphate enzyme, N-terminal TPP binding domain
MIKYCTKLCSITAEIPNPRILTCPHEEIAVHMAQGYAKIEGKPMAMICHGVANCVRTGWCAVHPRRDAKLSWWPWVAAKQLRVRCRRAENKMSEDEAPDANVVQLNDRITVTFSLALSKLIRAEIERQKRKGRSETAGEIVASAVRWHCEAMATE